MRKISYIERYTYNDYVNWEGKWELIDGIPVAMTPLPAIEHQNISGNIHFQLKQLLKNCKKCRPLIPVDWKISEDIVLQPDNLVIYREPKENYLTEAPELIFEILSPSTAIKDKTVKYEIYESQGVKYYVIIEPKTKTAEVFQLENGNYKKLMESGSGTFNFDLDECKIDFNFGQIWEF